MPGPPVWGPSASGQVFGDAGVDVDPRLHVPEPLAPGVAALGRYADAAGEVAVAWRDAGTHRSLFVGSAGLPAAAWRDVAAAAGCHFYLPEEPAGDAVDVGGRALAIHIGMGRGDAKEPRPRTVLLPAGVRWGQAENAETGEVVCEAPCTSFSTQPLAPGDVALFVVRSESIFNLI